LFLVGAVAICGLPPLNGFVSELFIYLGLFGALQRGGALLSLAALAVPALAMIGALAVACFVKAFGACFLGNPRSAEAARAKESPLVMLIPPAILAVICAGIGIAPFCLTSLLDSVVASWDGSTPGSLPSLGSLAPLQAVGIASAALLAAVVVLALLVRRLRRSARAGITWDCGYARPTSRMQYTASSFARGLVGMFAWALRPKAEPTRIQAVFPEAVSLDGEVDEAVLDRALLPAFRRVEGLSRWTHRFQAGLTQQYVLYILIALAALLLTLIPFDALIALVFTK